VETTVVTISTVSEDIRRAAVKLLNEGGFSRATISEICAVAGVDEAEFELHYSSADAVFLAIAESLVVDHEQNIDATMLRRRSLTESVRLALLAFWELVEDRLDEHRATKYMTLAGLATDDGLDGEPKSLYESFLSSAERRLLEMERIHSITWELPVRQLARMMLATLDGLVLDYMIVRDSAGSRQLLGLFAYHLAQHGRRVAKNYPH
jgi:AcrR family transcriptional regulator